MPFRSDPSLEFCSDLTEIPPDGFTPATGPESVATINNDFHRVIIDDSTTTQSDDRRFGRVKITYPGLTP